MSTPNTIAIDGPAASGKTTLAITLADHLGYLFFDTGVMYRAVTYVAIGEGDKLPSEEKCVALAKMIHIDIKPSSKEDGRLYDVLIDGEDKTLEIRQANIDDNVSVVAAFPGVRRALTEQQRRIGLQGGVVMVGRDIGTVVIPEAELKIYLDASVEERAQRRYQECIARGEKTTYEDILDSMRLRDEIDSNRQIAPLKPADDAILLNSDGLSAKQVSDRVKEMLEKAGIKSLS